MQNIKLRTHIGPDGILNLRIPVGLPEKVVEVIVIVQDIPILPPPATPEALGWPPGFFEETFGSFRDTPLAREPQGEYEQRDELR
jgi:hypothetical protein